MNKEKPTKEDLRKLKLYLKKHLEKYLRVYHALSKNFVRFDIQAESLLYISFQNNNFPI